jgi:hypothetical protein
VLERQFIVVVAVNDRGNEQKKGKTMGIFHRHFGLIFYDVRITVDFSTVSTGLTSFMRTHEESDTEHTVVSGYDEIRLEQNDLNILTVGERMFDTLSNLQRENYRAMSED